MSLLKFQEWNQINESKTIDKIINWFSGSFGGKIEKIDDLIKKYKDLELKFVDEWEEIKIDDDELKLSRSQIKYDPAEITKIDRMMQRNRELVEASKKSHSKKVDEIFSKLKDVIGSNKRLKDYWEVAKIKTDADVAEEMYKKAKKLTDKTEAESLYSRYKQAAIDARTKDEYFRASHRLATSLS
jgi:hypothetical protein